MRKILAFLVILALGLGILGTCVWASVGVKNGQFTPQITDIYIGAGTNWSVNGSVLSIYGTNWSDLSKIIPSAGINWESVRVALPNNGNGTNWEAFGV